MTFLMMSWWGSLPELKLQVIKDPDLVFAPCPKVLPYEDILGKDHQVRSWKDVMEDPEEEGISSWVVVLNGPDMKHPKYSSFSPDNHGRFKTSNGFSNILLRLDSSLVSHDT